MSTRLCSRYVFAALAATLPAFPPAAAWSAAWTQSEGTSVFSVPTTYTSIEKQFDADGNRVDRRHFRMVEVAPRFSYGVTDYLTAGIQPKFRHVELNAPDGKQTNTGFPEVDTFLRLRLWSEGHQAFSIQGLVKVPVDPREDSRVALGRNQVDTELRMLYGNRHDVGGGRIFYNAGLGYRKRFEEPSDEIHADAFIGWWSGGRWTLALHSLNTVGLSNQAAGVEVLTAEPDFRRHRLRLTAFYRATDSLGFSAGATRTIAGRRVGLENSVTGAMRVNF
jgi:hypothetical protein